MPIFLNPWFLMAVAAAAVPIALHLLHRRNPQPVPFSTLRFLQAAVAQTRRSRRVTQMLILLLRVAIVLLLAAAFARPRLRSAGWLPSGPRTVVLVLDASASMQARSGDKSSFDRARDWAGQVLTGLQERDRVALVVLGGDSPRPVWPALNNHALTRRCLQEAVCGWKALDLPTALAALLPEIRERHPGQVVELHVFSDFQEGGWARPAARELAPKLLPEDLHVFFNRIKPPDSGNTWVENVRLQPEALLGDSTLRARAAVGNDSRFAGPQTLRLDLDGQDRDQRGLPAGSPAPTEAELTAAVPAGADFARGELRLEPDALEADNHWYFALERRAQLELLVLEGGDAPTPTQADAFYLCRALNPARLEKPLLAATVKPWRELAALDLSPYRTVFVCDPPPFDGAAALKLERFAAQGGLLVLYPGPRGGLAQGWRQFKPLAGLTLADESFPTRRPFALLASPKPHELEMRTREALGRLPEFAGAERLLLRGADPAAGRFFHFDSDTPLALRVEVERGAIWLLALSAGRAWSEWPLDPSFVLFHQFLARQALQQQAGGNGALDVGGVAEIAWAGRETSLGAELEAPGGSRQRLVLERPDIGKPFLLSGFEVPGIYRLTLQTEVPTARALAANVPRSESRLSAVPAVEIAQQVRPAAVNQAEDPAEQERQLAGATAGRPLWPWLLLLAFLLGIGEELLANYRSWAAAVPDTLRQLLRMRPA